MTPHHSPADLARNEPGEAQQADRLLQWVYAQLDELNQSQPPAKGLSKDDH
jgi:hypothetical protein